LAYLLDNGAFPRKKAELFRGGMAQVKARLAVAQDPRQLDTCLQVVLYLESLFINNLAEADRIFQAILPDDSPVDLELMEVLSTLASMEELPRMPVLEKLDIFKQAVNDLSNNDQRFKPAKTFLGCMDLVLANVELNRVDLATVNRLLTVGFHLIQAPSVDLATCDEFEKIVPPRLDNVFVATFAEAQSALAGMGREMIAVKRYQDLIVAMHDYPSLREAFERLNGKLLSPEGSWDSKRSKLIQVGKFLTDFQACSVAPQKRSSFQKLSFFNREWDNSFDALCKRLVSKASKEWQDVVELAQAIEVERKASPPSAG